MFISSNRRFSRTNDYRWGERVPGGAKMKDRIRVVRPTAPMSLAPVPEAGTTGRIGPDDAPLPSAA